MADGWTGDSGLGGSSGFSQIRRVQRISRSEFECLCIASDIDSIEVPIASLVETNDLGRMIETSCGGANLTHGATGVVWLTGASISLKAVSG